MEKGETEGWRGRTGERQKLPPQEGDGKKKELSQEAEDQPVSAGVGGANGHALSLKETEQSITTTT